MYTIKHAAELTGVPVATLRAWEKRYGVVSPARSDNGYRVYSDADVDAFRTMGSLVADGWTPAQAAAKIARDGVAETAPPPGPQSTPPDVAPPAPDVARPPVEQLPAEPPHRAPAVPPADIEDFLDAAEHMDAERISAILSDRFMRAPFETTVDEWLLPALRSLLEASSRGRISAMAENMASHAVMRRVAMAFESTAHKEDGPRIIVGLAPGSRHELGSLSIATAARRAGLSVTYLGRDLTYQSWVEAVDARRPAAVVVMVVESKDASAAAEVLNVVRRDRPGLRTIVAGRFTHLVPDPVERFGPALGHDTKALAAELLAAAR
jgi:methylmalonyl-CoA mutase cobalamin-binding subunit